MLLVLAVTLLIVLVLFGWGALTAIWFERLAGIELRGAIAIGEYGLVGLAALAPIGLLLHLVIALDAMVGLAVVVVGLAGLVIGSRNLVAALGFGLPRAVTIVLLLGVAVAIAGETTQHPLPYDSGLYHLQTILMFEDSRVVLGAANIHMRFGYNSAWLILCALLTLPKYPLGAAMALNSVAALLCLTAMVQRAGNAARRHPAAISAVFAAGSILVIAFAKLLARNITGPSTDLSPALFTLYAFLLAVTAAEAVDGGMSECGAVLLAFPVAALAVVCKTSQAPVGLAVLLVASTAIPWHRPDGRRIVLIGAGAAALLAVAWVAHGIALSGCVLYPVRASCIADLPWTVPASIADDDRASITSFARIPDISHGRVPDDWRSFQPWFEEIRGERLVVCLKVVVVLIAVLLVLRMALRRWRCLWEVLDAHGKRVMLGLVAVAALGVGYWFLTAPALRFGLGFLITLPVLLLSLVFPWFSQMPARIGRWIASGIAVAAVLLAVNGVSQQTTAFLFVLPAIPAANVVEQRTAAGSLYYAPETGDSCWAAPRFCTPQTSPGLEFGSFGIWRMAVASR